MNTPDKTELADERILALMRGAGAERGLRMLMEKYQERLYWQIRRMVVGHEDANDVLQNCFIKVWRSIHTFEGKAKLSTWLYRIAVNEAITFINKRKQRLGTASLDVPESGLSNRLHADAWFDGDSAQAQLQEAIAGLPEKQKLVFQLRYFEEMSYQEMSAALGTSEGALKASFHHAVKKVEAFLSK